MSTYVSKGGTEEDTAGRKCVCNALLANIGHPQVRAGRHVEPGLVTLGSDVSGLRRFIASAAAGRADYGAADVMRILTALDGPARVAAFSI